MIEAWRSLAAILFTWLTLSAGAADAAYFDLAAINEEDEVSLMFEVEGIALQVTAGTFDKASNPSEIDFFTRFISQNLLGLGAVGPNDGGDVDGSGIGLQDVLVFTFDQGVTIDQIVFEKVDSNDDFSFGRVSGDSYRRYVDLQPIVEPTNTATFLTAVQQAGRRFGIGAIESGDNFRVKGLLVSEAPAISLPGGLPLILSALGVFVVLPLMRRDANGRSPFGPRLGSLPPALRLSAVGAGGAATLRSTSGDGLSVSACVAAVSRAEPVPPPA